MTVQHSIIAEGCTDRSIPKVRTALWIVDSRRNYARRSRQGASVGTRFTEICGAESSAAIHRLVASRRSNPVKASPNAAERTVNIVNNVIYGWSDRPTHRNDFGRVEAQFRWKLFRERTRE